VDRSWRKLRSTSLQIPHILELRRRLPPEMDVESTFASWIAATSTSCKVCFSSGVWLGIYIEGRMNRKRFRNTVLLNLEFQPENTRMPFPTIGWIGGVK
jgi:hypothetical protein